MSVVGKGRVVAVGVLMAALMGGGAPASAEETLLEQAYAADLADGRGDRDMVAALYREAAMAGDGVAHLRLGYFYETGDGVPQDYGLARQHYRAARDAGLVEAHLRLALCHLEGWGGPVDRNAFVAEMRAAAEADYVPAQRILAALYFTGFAVPADRAVGLDWMERAAAQDDAGAQYEMGKHLSKVRGAIRQADQEIARGWYQLSAEQEYTAAMNGMAKTFLSGKPGEHDWQTARSWFVLADEAGDEDAPFTLGLFSALYPGAGAEDRAQARTWFERAAARSNPRAVEVLELVESGRSLREAAEFVMRTPYDERYVEQVARRPRATEGSDFERPQVVRVVRPVYPMSLRLVETSGEATVEFVVDVTGRVRNPRVVKATHPLMGERAVDAVSRWRFLPARKGGRLVNTRMRVPIIFTISERALGGVDGILSYARDKAMEMGPEIQALAPEIQLARPLDRLPTLAEMGVTPPPSGFRVFLLLILDKEGVVQSGHVLDADPVEFGPITVAHLVGHRFQPTMVAGEAVVGAVFLPVVRRPSAPPSG